MKWPFFKSNQVETETNRKLVVPPRPPANPVSYRLKETQPLAETSAVTGADEDLAVSLAFDVISDQLPGTLFTPDMIDQLSDQVLEVPAHTLVSQLPKGKVTMTIGEVLALLPSNLAPQTSVSSIRQQLVTLPIDLIVSSLPSEAFNVANEEASDDDDAELNALPALFDDEFIARAEAATAEEATANEASPKETSEIEVAAELEWSAAPAAAQDEVETESDDETILDDDEAPIFSEIGSGAASPSETQKIAFPAPAEAAAHIEPTPAPEPEPEPEIEPAPVAEPVSESEAIGTELPAGVPATVSVRLASLATALPAAVCARSAEELLKKIDPEATVDLPTAPILGMLNTGRVALPVPAVAAVVPSEWLISPLPDTDGQQVSLPLNEIIPQLPPSVFGAGAAQDETDTAVDETDAELDSLFQEREAAPPLPPEPVFEPVATTATPEAEETLEPTPEPAPEPTPEPVAEVEPEPVVEVQPEPVAEIEPEPASEVEPEPVVEVQPEPVAETESVDEDADDDSNDFESAFGEIDDESAEETAEEEPELVPVAEIPPAVNVSLPHEDVVSATADAGETDAAAEKFDLQKFLVNINTCCVDDLTNIPGVGKAMANRIINFREANGPFESVQQLRKIPGIGRKTFRAVAGVSLNSINRALRVDDDRELSLQEVVQLTAELKGIDGCILTSADGLFLTGQLPPHLDENRLSVFAPQLFKKVGSYATELSVGNVHRMTMFTDQQPVSIFQAGDIYLIVIHDTRHFSKALLRRLTRISEGIARLCRQRAIV